jgi:putative peptide zinc metalloprotease protein
MPLLRRSWLALLLAAILAVAAPAQSVLAQGDSDDNGAVAINDEDGSSKIDIAFDLEQVLDGVVDQTNAAVAYASCEQCQTIAIAVQIVLVNSPVDVIAPHNIAVAINDDCVTCVTVALAYQIVIGQGQKLEFTREAKKRLRAIATALRRLERSDGTAQEVVDEFNRIMTDLTDVLSTGLRAAGPLRAEDDDEEERDRDEAGDQRSGEPDDAATPEAAGTPTPSPAPSEPGATPTATPSPQATATPSPTATAEPTVTPEPTATATP